MTGKRFGARRLTLIGVLTAMAAVTTVFTRIPVGYGYFNLGDAVILVAGVLFGGFTGAFAGAVGAALADVVTGAYIYAPITFIVKGLEGYIAGRVYGNGNGKGRLMAALVAGACVMVAGYFLGEATVLALFDRVFGFGAAVAELPFNLLQGGISVALARVAIGGFRRSRII